MQNQLVVQSLKSTSHLNKTVPDFPFLKFCLHFFVIKNFVIQVTPICIFHHDTKRIGSLIKECLFVSNYVSVPKKRYQTHFELTRWRPKSSLHSMHYSFLCQKAYWFSLIWERTPCCHFCALLKRLSYMHHHLHLIQGMRFYYLFFSLWWSPLELKNCLQKEWLS